MKTLILTALLTGFLALTAIAPVAAFADPIETIEAIEDNRIAADSIDSILQIPAAGDAIGGKVISSYAGSAYALETYTVVVGNLAAPCEGDDCWAFETFEIRGFFAGKAKAVYSRKIDAKTYSIAILADQVIERDSNEGGVDYVPSKILLRVKFTAEGVAKTAGYQVVRLKK